MKTAEDDGFEVFITGDQTLSSEQNLSERRVAIVVLSCIDWHILRNNLPPILAALGNARAGSVQEVQCGGSSRKFGPEE